MDSIVIPASGFAMLPVVAQLREGVSIEAALAETGMILRELRGATETPALALVRVQDQMVAPVRAALLVLTVTVGFVLLISCVNVANLVLARASSREREIAVRRALGASGGRIARWFVAESLVLAVAGGAAGIALAFGGINVLRLFGTSLPRQDLGSGVSIPRLAEVSVDASTLIFALLASLLTGLLFGLAPVMGLDRLGPVDALRSGATRAGSSGGHLTRYRLRGGLVVAEIGMAMMLLVGASLMLNSFVKLARVDPGYDATGVLTFQVTLPEGQDMAMFAEELVARLRSVDGVRIAGYAAGLPMDQSRGRMPLRSTPGPPKDKTSEADRTADPRYVSQDYLEAMGIGVVAGRGFGDRDVAGSQPVIVVNQSLARSGIVGSDPVGTRVYALFGKPWEIVGVVKDVRQGGLDREPRPQFFMDLRQVPGFPFSEFRPYFAVRTSDEVTPLLTNLRDIVRQVESRASVDNVATMDRDRLEFDLPAATLYRAAFTARGGGRCPCRCRHLWTDGVPDGTAGARDRHSNGAGRTAFAGRIRSSRTEQRLGPYWRRFGSRPGVGTHALPRRNALRTDAARPGDVCRGNGAVHRGGTRGVICSRAPRDEGRSVGGAESGVIEQ